MQASGAACGLVARFHFEQQRRYGEFAPYSSLVSSFRMSAAVR
jgi:hypothetical protein